MDDLSSLPEVDQDAIGLTLISLLTGFQERDADKLTNVYSVDADWVNAFGNRQARCGRDPCVYAGTVRRWQLQRWELEGTT